MKKRGTANEQIVSTVVYIIVLVIFSAGMFYYVQQLQEKAGIWEDYYSKEIALIINSMRSGDEIVIDVHKATEVAKNNGQNFNEIFSLDFDKKKVCVKLSAGRKSCYSYFNDIRYTSEMKYGVPRNVLVINAKSELNSKGGSNEKL